MSTNASRSKKGYNYQDVVAVTLLVKDIRRLKKINDEGQEDVSLFFADGHVDLIQAKERGDYRSKKVKYLKTALRDLINQTKRYKHIKRPKYLIYITNSHFPLGDRPQYEFSISNLNIKIYSYKEFDDTTKKYIQNRVSAISKITKYSGRQKNRTFKYPYIYNLEHKHPVKLKHILESLAVGRFSYEGLNDESKLSLAYVYIKRFLYDANLEIYPYNSIFDDLYRIVNSSSEDEDKCITKNKFISEIFVDTFHPSRNSINNFFTYCNIDVTKSYLSHERDAIKSMFLNQYNYKFPIMDKYLRYQKKYKYISNNLNVNQFNIIGNFINRHVRGLAKIVNQHIMTSKQLNKYKNNRIKFHKKLERNNRLKEIVKYISWITITDSEKIKYIKEASDYDNQ